MRRHATRPQAREFGPETMHDGYQESDRLPFVAERIIAAGSSLEGTVERVWNETGLQRRQDAGG